MAPRRIHVPKAEAKLFSVLLAHAGEVVSSNELVIECTVDEQLTPSAIKVRVGRMRALLEPLCSTIIETCRGQGFRIPLSVLVEDDGEPEASGMNWSRAA